ncbi:MAG TPA: hypothetical protein VJO35_02795 [Terriglobales bacterium]|nr:hypothetical protein [Terriglobales bacterium]
MSHQIVASRMHRDRTHKKSIAVMWDYYYFLSNLFAGPILLVLALALPIRAQEFDPQHVVFPLTDFTPAITYVAPLHAFTGPTFTRFGTGFCLDHDCRFVGTTYHVAKAMGDRVFIKRVFSAHRYLDSSSDDPGAEDVKFAGGSFPFMFGGSMRLNPAHDLAIYEMRHPLKQFHGISFETDEDWESSPEVDIYAYPFNWNPKRGLVCWHGKFVGKNSQGLLAFSYEEDHVRGGASGGIVVDSKTKKIVGILNEVAEGRDRVAFAVPVKELSDFVARAQPYLQTILFPKTVFLSPMAADLYPPYFWPRLRRLSNSLPESPEILNLRRTAQNLADSMRNFTATETLSWGHENREPDLTDAYETVILDGWQRWRRLRDGRWFYNDSPLPRLWLNGSISTGDQWMRLPLMIGTELNLKIHHAPDALVGGRMVRVFQYVANAEDRVCLFKLFGSFETTNKSYDCHGEVWTDQAGTILRISEAIDLSGPWYGFNQVMTYGRLKKDGKQYLVPVTFATKAVNHKTYWCRGLFTDYDMFNAKARLLLSNETEEAQKSAHGAQ